MLADLLSDTLTAPSAAMREAMAHAAVGDDVFGEDPTVRALEERVADLLGHEAGLFSPTGSLANQLGIRLHVGPGQELVADQQAHVLRAEMGAGGGLLRHHEPLVAERARPARPGRPDVARHDRGRARTRSRPRSSCSRTPTTSAAARCSRSSAIREVRAATPGVGVAMHLDGARLWNAHVASGVSLRDYGTQFDTVSVCLSKGLGAPVGSVLVGSAEQMAEARIWRKRYGAGHAPGRHPRRGRAVRPRPPHRAARRRPRPRRALRRGVRGGGTGSRRRRHRRDQHRRARRGRSRLGRTGVRRRRCSSRACARMPSGRAGCAPCGTSTSTTPAPMPRVDAATALLRSRAA